MAQNASVNKRSGDEYYTKSETIKEIIKRYYDIFEKLNYIWIPFNSDDKSIYTEFVKEFKNVYLRFTMYPLTFILLN